MTTRAGFTGLLTGLIITFILYPLTRWLGGSSFSAWIAVTAAVGLALAGGILAVRWSGAHQPWHCAALGGLAGGLAGVVVFGLFGAAAASVSLVPSAAGICLNRQAALIGHIVTRTMQAFLLLFLGGSGLGALGGWFARPRQTGQSDTFDKTAPQMAMNATITAVPDSVVAAALTAAVFSRLADSVGRQTEEVDCATMILEWPLAVSLLLALLSQFVLTLVIPHEAREAEHRSGMDEVKMAAFVGIGAAPVLALLLFLGDGAVFSSPLVLTALLASLLMSLLCLRTLLMIVLPRRKSFPVPPEGRQKTEANLFGTIAVSRGPRLVVLCIGCGLMMVLPLYVSVISVLINLASLTGGSAFAFIPDIKGKIFLEQALASTGLSTAASAVLSLIYLFYLNLGRGFRKWNSRRSS